MVYMFNMEYLFYFDCIMFIEYDWLGNIVVGN